MSFITHDNVFLVLIVLNLLVCNTHPMPNSSTGELKERNRECVEFEKCPFYAFLKNNSIPGLGVKALTAELRKANYLGPKNY